MSIFSKLFRKGRNNEEDEQLEEVYDEDNEGLDDDDYPYDEDDENVDTDEWDTATVEGVATSDDELDINYRGGLLSPTQKPKEAQYQEILDNITEETLAIIDNALKIEAQLYDVFEHIESKGISLLTLVALDMTSEEDISAYQLKKQRHFENTGLVVDEDYAQEVAQSQMEKPNQQFQIDAEELEQVSVEASPEKSPQTTTNIWDTPYVENVEPMIPNNENDLPVPTIETDSKPSSSIFSGNIFGQTPQTEEAINTESPLPPVDLPQPSVNTQPTGIPRGNPATLKGLEGILRSEKPTLPKIEPTPPSPSASQFMANMELAEAPTQNVVQESVSDNPIPSTSQELPVTPPIDEKYLVKDEPSVAVPKTEEVISEPVKEQPTEVQESPKVPSFLQDMEQITEEPKKETPKTDTQEEVIPEKAGTFAGVQMEFEGYEEKEEEDTSGSPTDVLDGLRALFGGVTPKKRRNPVITPTLSDKKVEEKAQQVQKYKRKATVKDTRIYIIWDGLNLPTVEGYQFKPVHTLRDLSSFGLDTNDLLIVTSQIPKGLVDSIDAYLSNIREEEQPYRIVNFAKKPYETTHIDKTLNALTKEALDTYYANNPIVIEKKNQLSGFGGIADFLTKKGGDK